MILKLSLKSISLIFSSTEKEKGQISNSDHDTFSSNTGGDGFLANTQNTHTIYRHPRPEVVRACRNKRQMNKRQPEAEVTPAAQFLFLFIP